jgi:signal transduction histidine kinase
MTGQHPLLLLPGAGRAGYCGEDRRGTLARLAEPALPRFAVGVLLGVVAVPLAGMIALRLLPPLSAAAASVGAADAALVTFVAAGVLLLLRWRLVGEAAFALQGVGILVAGLVVVPAIPASGPPPGYVGALQTTAVAAMLVLLAASLRLPPICAALRPARIAIWAFGLSLGVAAPLTFLIVSARQQSAAMAAIRGAEALAAFAVAVPVLARGIRSHHPLFVGSGAALVAIGAACATLAAGWALAGGTPPAPPSFFLVVGAGQLLLVAAADLRAAFGEVALRDVRGRRRWIAAESEVDRLRRSQRGRRHDIASMLSAVDGSLMVLAEQREQLSADISERLISAVRGQIQQLMASLAPDGGSPQRYDVSALLRELAAVHASALPGLRIAVPEDLELEGRPDRVVLIVNNLLANAASHAPGAEVTLNARPRPGEEGVEIVVADAGPGMAEADLQRACEQGWRGEAARSTPGRGLGLFQCRELAEAEGGALHLRATHPLATGEGRGLTVAVRLPLRAPSPSSAILQMRLTPNGGIPDGEMPGRPGHLRRARAGTVAGAAPAEGRNAR